MIGKENQLVVAAYEKPAPKIGDANKWNKVRLPSDSVIVIKPDIDASNKEIFFKNNFRTNADNLLQFV